MCGLIDAYKDVELQAIKQLKQCGIKNEVPLSE